MSIVVTGQYYQAEINFIQFASFILACLVCQNYYRPNKKHFIVIFSLTNIKKIIVENNNITLWLHNLNIFKQEQN